MNVKKNKKMGERPDFTASAGVLPAYAQGRRILVVDDNQASAQTLAWMLELMGHEVVQAYDAAAALELALVYTPEVVLLDIGMPGMNGYDLCAHMRAMPHLASALIVAQTGWAQREYRIRSLEAGFDHYLVKPIEMEALEAILDMSEAA